MTDDPAFGFTEDDLRTQPTVFRGDLFAGKTVLVSGAGSGLGKAMAALFARLGANLTVCGRDAEKIGRAIDHLTSVVADVTAFGPAGVLERETVAVGGLLDEVLAAVAERAATAGIQIVRRDEPGLGVRGDARALRQALRAFIDNAMDAMPRGGTLTVSLAREDGTIAITMADSGAGLSPAAQARLFEPFFTTKPDKVGLGATMP